MPATLAPPALDDSHSDVRLLARIKARDIGAFEELYERYHARAYRVARAVCHDDGSAEEAVQDAFMAIWRRPGGYDSERGGVAGWMLSIARYRAIDAVRGNVRHASKRADEEQLESHHVRHDMTDRLVERDEADRITEQLRRLPDAQREVVALAFYGQLTHAEIALRLRLPPGTVKGRMRLGLQKLSLAERQAQAAERSRAALTSALYEGDAERAGIVVHEATGHMPAATMLDDVLAPALHLIGALWQTREITVADEHLATAICHRLLAQVTRALTIAPAKSRAKVLLVSPPSERHTLGLLMAHNVLYGAGYDARLIGGGIAESDLKDALRRREPAVVALSATMPGAGELRDFARTIHETLPDVRLLTGGVAASEPPGDIPAHFVPRLDGLLRTVEHCLAAGHRRRGSEPATGGVREVLG
jgi:RNA polymerase sigma-70 factor (ECF subfamily)